MTRRPWDAQVDLDPARAAALIDGQFPELAPARLELLGATWTHTARYALEQAMNNHETPAPSGETAPPAALDRT